MIFSLFDIIILTIISIFTLLGVYKGFIKISIDLLSFAFSVMLTIITYPHIKLYFSKSNDDIFTSILCGIVTYLILFIITNIISSKFISLLESARFNIYDRFFGIILGFVKGIAVALIIYISIIIFQANNSNIVKFSDLSNIKNINYPQWIKGSMTVPYLEHYLKQILKIIPENVKHISINKYLVKEPIEPKVEKINNNVDKNSADKIMHKSKKDDNEYEYDDKKNIISFIKKILF